MANDKLMFYTEMIKLNREEVRTLGTYWIYILIGLGAGVMTSATDNVTPFSLVAITLAVLVFALFYMVRVRHCARALQQASRGLRDHNLLTADELKGFDLSPRGIRWTFGFLAYVPVLVMVVVIVAAAVR